MDGSLRFSKGYLLNLIVLVFSLFFNGDHALRIPTGEQQTLAKEMDGSRNFAGFQLYNPESPLLYDMPQTCVKALTETIKCDDSLRYATAPSLHSGPLGKERGDSICDAGCGASLKRWFEAVSTSCDGYDIRGVVPMRIGGFIYQAYNETCLKDPTTDEYCGDIMDAFTTVASVDDMSDVELCSFCNTKFLKTMQASSYSVYNDYYKHSLELAQSKCGFSGPTDFPPSLVLRKPPSPAICPTGDTYTTKAGDTCDSIALEHNVSSDALFGDNSKLYQRCHRIPVGVELCLPFPCNRVYTIQPNDTCITIEMGHKMNPKAIGKHNPWIDPWCSNLHDGADVRGTTLCLPSPIFATIDWTPPPYPHIKTGPAATPGYSWDKVPAPANTTIPESTTRRCGMWHTVQRADTCAMICMQHGLLENLFTEVNPSLPQEDCSSGLVVGTTYCVAPTVWWDWKADDFENNPYD